MNGWGKRAGGALVALALLAGFPAAAQVPDPFSRELAHKLAQAEQILNQSGYSRAAGPFAGGLRPRQARRYTVTLRAGLDYRIVGVCDSRCGDIDLHLYDSAANEIAQDVLDDNIPVLQVRPASTGAYQIEVDMYRCAAAPDPCWYAFNVYSR
jgi:hypothetical protein